MKFQQNRKKEETNKFIIQKLTSIGVGNILIHLFASKIRQTQISEEIVFQPMEGKAKQWKKKYKWPDKK